MPSVDWKLLLFTGGWRRRHSSLWKTVGTDSHFRSELDNKRDSAQEIESEFSRPQVICHRAGVFISEIQRGAPREGKPEYRRPPRSPTMDRSP